MCRWPLVAMQLIALIWAASLVSNVLSADPSRTEFWLAEEQPEAQEDGVLAETWSEPATSLEISSDAKCRCVDHDPGHPRKPSHEKPGDRNWGDAPPARYCQCGHCRAGSPLCIARWAKLAVTCRYAGGYVGGGAARGGRCRHPHEGTWGLDYCGWLSPRRVFSQWTCGREQAGEGAYATD